MNLIDTIIRRLEQRMLGKVERYIDSQRGRSANNAGALVSAALVCVLSVGVLLTPAGARAEDGAYTEAQAQSGERVYSEHCAGCHGAKLEGKGNVPALSGAAFIKRCEDNGHSVDDLLFIMRSFMPYNEPGKLSKQQYADIMAYLLKVNGFAPGTQTLSSDTQTKVALTTTR